MIVVQVVEHAASRAPPDDEAEVAEHAELLRDRRGVHLYGLRELADAEWTAAKGPEDAHPACRGERLHRRSDAESERSVELIGSPQVPSGHRPEDSAGFHEYL